MQKLWEHMFVLHVLYLAALPLALEVLGPGAELLTVIEVPSGVFVAVRPVELRVRFEFPPGSILQSEEEIEFVLVARTINGDFGVTEMSVPVQVCVWKRVPMMHCIICIVCIVCKYVLYVL